MKKFLPLIVVLLLISCSGKTILNSFNNINNSQDNDNTYTIRFLNDEGTKISEAKYSFGDKITVPTITPSKENPLPEYTYTFTGWSPSVALVTEDVDYVATYKIESIKTCNVIWVDGNDTTIETDSVTYGSTPMYHGNIPTKNPTSTTKYMFKGWNPEVGSVTQETTTYTAQFDPIPISTEYSIQINCTDCLVNKKRSINEKHAPLADLTYQFNNTSKETYHYPYKLDVSIDGVVTNDYVYDNITGKLNIKLTGNTVINAVADNSCVLMKYKYSAEYPTVEITCDGNFERVDWGDGTTIDETNKQHTYSFSPDIDQYDIRVFGKLSSIGTTSKAVSSVDIFHSVTSIKNYAFESCVSLTSITIPDSTTSIGDGAFWGCKSLTSITIPEGVTSICGVTFYGCSSLVSITIPDSVFSIGDSAFQGCASLVSITIPDSVFSIGGSAFEDCSSLASITIPYGVTFINGFTFRNCSSLTSINIPDSVVSIGGWAFDACNIDSIIIPSSVESVGDYAFLYWGSNQTIYCEAEFEPSGWSSLWRQGCEADIVWGYNP